MRKLADLLQNQQDKIRPKIEKIKEQELQDLNETKEDRDRQNSSYSTIRNSTFHNRTNDDDISVETAMDASSLLTQWIYKVYVAFMFREILDFLNENEDISRPMLSEKTLETPRIGIEKNKFYELILDIEIGKKINRDNWGAKFHDFEVIIFFSIVDKSFRRILIFLKTPKNLRKEEIYAKVW